MAKDRVGYLCTSCGFESGKWYGRCPNCSSWNSFVEIEKTKEKTRSEARLLKLGEVEKTGIERLKTGFSELDRVLGGGVVPGSVVLLSGDPGIGKSTLLLQTSINLAKQGKTVFYVTGEESEDQVRLRSQRLVPESLLSKLPVFILVSGDTEQIVKILSEKKPDFVIVDSIQTMQEEGFPSFPGSLPQVRQATQRFVNFAKKYRIPVFLVGHVTKEGIVAGPMLLSHMVDAVLYLEGEKFFGTRILRAFKNRFGDVSEVGIFNMEEKGLVEAGGTLAFVESEDQKVPGRCLTVLIEGTRPLLVEIQSLVVLTPLAFPRRVVQGIEERRLEILVAIMQKHLRLPLQKFDIFVNVVGGIKISERAGDLAVCLSIYSSFKNKPLVSTCAIGEVGLLGEIRPVIQLEKRIKEAQRFGIKNIIADKAKFLRDIIGNR
jgi:DNA repair protein RadA/Sms